MVEILPLKEKEEVKALFDDKKIDYSKSSCAVVAKEDGKQLGYCLFELTDCEITIKAIEPLDDLPLADGILRSALHIALLRGIATAKFTDKRLVGLFLKLKFIDNEKDRTLKILNPCQGCGS